VSAAEGIARGEREKREVAEGYERECKASAGEGNWSEGRNDGMSRERKREKEIKG